MEPTMTPNDLRLIEAARKLRPWEYSLVYDMIDKADTDQARGELSEIGWELYDLMQASL